MSWSPSAWRVKTGTWAIVSPATRGICSWQEGFCRLACLQSTSPCLQLRLPPFSRDRSLEATLQGCLLGTLTTSLLHCYPVLQIRRVQLLPISSIGDLRSIVAASQSNLSHRMVLRIILWGAGRGNHIGCLELLGWKAGYKCNKK